MLPPASPTEPMVALIVRAATTLRSDAFMSPSDATPTGDSVVCVSCPRRRYGRGVRRLRIASIAAVTAALMAGVLPGCESGDGEDERPVRQRVSAAQVERNLEHEYRCELGYRRARATCRPKGRARFACAVAQRGRLGTSTVELEIDGADYEPVPGC